MEKRTKYFTKFDNSINKERILAKLMRYNFNIINNMLLKNPAKAQDLEFQRDKFYVDALLHTEEYLKYCKAVLKQAFTENLKYRKAILEEAFTGDLRLKKGCSPDYKKTLKKMKL